MNSTRNICRFPLLLVLPVNEDRMEQVIKTYQVPTTKDREVVYSEIMDKIEEGLRNQVKEKVIRLKSVYRLTIPIAASLIVILLLHFLISVKTFENNTNHVYTLRLPDHSRIVLSQNSTASFPRYWWRREVKLHGEAYFEVQKGGKFIVKTREGNVGVLGTRFQVSEVNNGLIISCYEGKVQFDGNDQVHIIPAGNSLEYKNQAFSAETSITDEYPPSARFDESFQNEDLSTVLKAVEDFFDVRIHLITSGNKHFTGKVETGKAETALMIICRSLNLNYTFDSKGEIFINDK